MSWLVFCQVKKVRTKKKDNRNEQKRERDGTERGGGGGKRRRKLSWLFRALAHPTDVDHEDIRRKGKKLFPSSLIVQRQERVGKNLLSSLTSVFQLLANSVTILVTFNYFVLT